MTKPTLASTEVNVLQAVNLTLGTSAVLALADSLPKLVNFANEFSLTRSLQVVLLVSWIIKLIVENHRSFGSKNIQARPGYAIFQLAMTIAMFLALVVSCKVLDNFQTSMIWLGLSMAAGLIWLGGLAIYYVPNFNAKLYPWPLAASAVVSIFGSFLLSFQRFNLNSGLSVMIILVMVLALWWDAMRSKSFSIV